MSIIEVVSKLAPVATAGCAVYGVVTWRKTQTGKRNVDLADETLQLVYEIRDVVLTIRTPVVCSNEVAHVKEDGESNSRFDARQAVAPIYARLKEHSETINKFYSLRYRFMAAFGAETSVHFERLQEVFRDIQSAAFVYQQMTGPINKEASSRSSIKTMSMTHQSGPVTEQDDGAVEAFEAICRQVIDGNPTIDPGLGAWWTKPIGCLATVRKVAVRRAIEERRSDYFRKLLIINRKLQILCFQEQPRRNRGATRGQAG